MISSENLVFDMCSSPLNDETTYLLEKGKGNETGMR